MYICPIFSLEYRKGLLTAKHKEKIKAWGDSPFFISLPHTIFRKKGTQGGDF